MYHNHLKRSVYYIMKDHMYIIHFYIYALSGYLNNTEPVKETTGNLSLD